MQKIMELEAENKRIHTEYIEVSHNAEGRHQIEIAKLQDEIKRLRDALIRLVNESTHFKNTKIGECHLLAAIYQANQTLEQ